MTVLNDKDPTTRLENIRLLREYDPPYYPALNRPEEDLTQRTIDIEAIFRPARGLRVHQTFPPTSALGVGSAVIVESGIYLNDNVNPYYFPQGGAATTLSIPICTPGKRRIDLVYFNVETGVAARSAGVEVSSATPFLTIFADPTPYRGTIPTSNSSIPLAYIYVDDSPEFVVTDTATALQAGHIRDARLSPGCGTRKLETSVAVLQTDTDGGSPGVASTTVRSDHQHPPNVGSAIPAFVGPDEAASIGTPGAYSRVGHQHPVRTETADTIFLPDGVASVGTRPYFPRSDHQHPANVGSVLPAQLLGPTYAGVHGVSSEYAREDHVHAMVGFKLGVQAFHLIFNDILTEVGTGALSITPIWAYVFGLVADHWSIIGGGGGIGTPGYYYTTTGIVYSTTGTLPVQHGSVGNGDRYDAAASRQSATAGIEAVAAQAYTDGVSHVGLQPNYTFTVTKFSKAAGIALTPNFGGLTVFANLHTIVFGIVS